MMRCGLCSFGLGKVKGVLWTGLWGLVVGKRGRIVMTWTDGYVCGDEDGMGVGTLEL